MVLSVDPNIASNPEHYCKTVLFALIILSKPKKAKFRVVVKRKESEEKAYCHVTVFKGFSWETLGYDLEILFLSLITPQWQNKRHP